MLLLKKSARNSKKKFRTTNRNRLITATIDIPVFVAITVRVLEPVPPFLLGAEAATRTGWLWLLTVKDKKPKLRKT